MQATDHDEQGYSGTLIAVYVYAVLNYTVNTLKNVQLFSIPVHNRP